MINKILKPYTLKDLLEIKNGRDHKDLQDGNIPVFGSGGIMRFVNKSIYNHESILLPRKGSLSNIQYTNKPFWTVDTLYYTVINQKLANSYYLYYYLRNLDLSRLNSGTGVPSMTFHSYYNLEIFLPKLEIQNKIANVLSSLDSKIELNNKINTELEAMTKTLYDYWFVQFDFPDKNGKPYKSNGGKMIYNEELKREIPIGWEVGKLDKFASIAKGDLITNKTSEIGKIKVVAGGLDFAYFHSKPNRKENTITISGSGASAGYINFWREEIFASDCTTVRGQSDLETLLILQFLKQNQNQIYRQSKGSAQPHVYPNDIKSLLYIEPHKDFQEKLIPILLPLNKKIGNNIKENQHLTELRDWLLPMLMNGQVTVSNESAFGKDEVLAMVAEPSTIYEKRI